MLTLRYYGDPALTRRTRRVEIFDGALESLAREMVEVMRAHGGIALAANQVGESVRLLVMDTPGAGAGRDAFAMANPRVASRSGSHTDEEGCLSFPGLRLVIKRPMNVRMEGFDLKGNPISAEVSGLLARAFLHELDHLNGVTFFRRLPFLKFLGFLPRLPGLKRKYHGLSGTPVPGGSKA